MKIIKRQTPKILLIDFEVPNQPTGEKLHIYRLIV